MANVRQSREKIENRTWLSLGIMSGTSLDGVDLCLCQFKLANDQWIYNIYEAKTYGYTKKWQNDLAFRDNLSAHELLELDHKLGCLYGDMVVRFLQEHNIDSSTIDLIASHGHTIYHRPADGITLQLGNGPEIFTATNITTVCDFRKQDLALGGQGAPLVPIGDKHLFAQYNACLNLGGFANISFIQNDKSCAFDIAPINFVLNPLARKLGQPYDDGGELARIGTIHTDLLNDLNSLPYYKLPFPKSLGAEWVWQKFNPIVDRYSVSAKDALHTLAVHMTDQIAEILNSNSLKKCLVTGGGAHNTFLVHMLRQKTTCELLVPDHQTVDYKEALIFAFMGLLRLQGQNNVLASVTGAKRDHSSGIIYG